MSLFKTKVITGSQFRPRPTKSYIKKSNLTLIFILHIIQHFDFRLPIPNLTGTGLAGATGQWTLEYWTSGIDFGQQRKRIRKDYHWKSLVLAINPI